MTDESGPAGRHVASTSRMSGPKKLIAGLAAVGIVGAGAFVLTSDPDPNLDPSVAAVESECTADGANGVATNNADVDATIVIEVEFYDEAGTFLHKASATRPGLAPGDEVDWELLYDASLASDGTGDYVDCVVSVPSVFRFNR